MAARVGVRAFPRECVVSPSPAWRLPSTASVLGPRPRPPSLPLPLPFSPKQVGSAQSRKPALRLCKEELKAAGILTFGAFSKQYLKDGEGAAGGE